VDSHIIANSPMTFKKNVILPGFVPLAVRSFNVLPASVVLRIPSP